MHRNQRQSKQECHRCVRVPSYTSLSPLPPPWLPCETFWSATTTLERKGGTSPFFPSRFSRRPQIRYLHPPNRSIRVRKQRVFTLILTFLPNNLLLLSLFLQSF